MFIVLHVHLCHKAWAVQALCVLCPASEINNDQNK